MEHLQSKYMVQESLPFAKDAKEVVADCEGRWFAFRLDAQSLLVIEKRTIPTHLADLECLDAPRSVDAIMRELEDSGEATNFNDYYVFCFHSILICYEVGPTSTILFIPTHNRSY